MRCLSLAALALCALIAPAAADDPVEEDASKDAFFVRVAEVAEEIRPFLEHDNVDAGAREQISQHHSRRAAPCYAAARSEFVR